MDLERHIRRLRAFYRREKRVPGYDEMLKIFGYRSKNAVYGLLNRLEELGYLRKNHKGKIAFTDQLVGTIKHLGAVQAGFPSPAEEELVDLLSLDEFLVEHPEATYMLTVSGDSMIEAGIHPGDIVLVERGRQPRNNDIVVAHVDEEWTLKYFIRRRNRITLEPANKRYKSITPKQSLVIGGIVKAVIRKYG
jgi:repressor LexA